MTCSYPGCRKPVLAKGYCSAHYKRARAGRLPDPSTPKVGDPSGYGHYGVLDHDGGRVLCHECGRWLRSIGGHLRTHGMTAREYKQAHGLPRGTPLISRELSQQQSETARGRVGTASWKRFEKKRDPAAASHARGEDSHTMRGEHIRRRADTARKNVEGQRRPVRMKQCAVCGEDFHGYSRNGCCSRRECSLVARVRSRGYGPRNRQFHLDLAGGASVSGVARRAGITHPAVRGGERTFLEHMTRLDSIEHEVGRPIEREWWEK